MKALVRDLIGGALSISGATRPRRFGRGRLTIATFHRVLPEEQRARYPFPMLAVTPEELGWYLDFFREHFLCTTLIGAWTLFNRDAFPERPLLAITFDDAQVDNFAHARPVLAERNLKASFYVPVEAVAEQAPLWHDRLGFAVVSAVEKGRADAVAELCDAEPLADEVVEAAKTWSPEERRSRVQALEVLGEAEIPEWGRLMTWDELRTLAEEGHEIGSHSMSHALLPQLEGDALTYEVETSKARIEAAIDRPVSSFCYPNGDADDASAAAVQSAGYAAAVTTRWGTNELGQDPYLLRRCDMNAFYARSATGGLSRARLAWRMSGLHPGL